MVLGAFHSFVRTSGSRRFFIARICFHCFLCRVARYAGYIYLRGLDDVASRGIFMLLIWQCAPLRSRLCVYACARLHRRYTGRRTSGKECWTSRRGFLKKSAHIGVYVKLHCCILLQSLRRSGSIMHMYPLYTPRPRGHGKTEFHSRRTDTSIERITVAQS